MVVVDAATPDVEREEPVHPEAWAVQGDLNTRCRLFISDKRIVRNQLTENYNKTGSRTSIDLLKV